MGRTTLSIITINITGKKERIAKALNKYKQYDIIGITEAGIRTKDVEGIKKLPNARQYVVYTSTLATNFRASCVLFIHNRWLSSKESPLSNRSISISIKKHHTKEIKIHLIYGPHEQKTEFWEKIQNKVDTTQSETIIFGDFNAYANTQLDSRNPECRAHPYIKDLMDSCGLIDGWRKDNPEKREYTFERKEAASRIDYILMSHKLEKHRIQTETKIHKTDIDMSKDHSPVSVSINVKAALAIDWTSEPTVNLPTKLNIKKLKENVGTYQQIMERELTHFSLGQNTDEKLKRIATKTFDKAMEIAGTLQQAMTPARKENDRLTKYKTYYNRLHNAFKSTTLLQEGAEPTKAINKLQYNAKEFQPDLPLNGNWSQFREKVDEMKNKLHNKIENMETEIRKREITKAIEELQNLEQKDPKKFYRKMKGNRNEARIERAIRTDNTRTGDPEEVKEIAKEKMGALFQYKEIENKGKTWLETDTMKKKAEQIRAVDDTGSNITVEEVLNMLKSLKKLKNKATSDNKPMELYTLIPETMALVLTPIFNEIFHEGELPDCWKEGKIHMIFKPGPTATPENVYDFRPITLLSASYKLYTHILNQRIRKVHDQFFSENQGGFRKAKACHHKLRTLKNLIQHAKTNKKEIHLLYLDIKKAYDNVSAEEVAQTMEAFGYNTNITKAIRALGKGIRSRVITAHGITEPFEVKSGLRQGCPISPLLFIIFLEPLIFQINESNNGYRIKMDAKISNLAYADDMVLVMETFQQTQQGLDIVNKFFNKYQLEISVKGKDKTAYTHNNPTRQDLNYTDFNGNRINIPFLEPDECYPYLGVWISLTLNWNKQIEMINKTIWKYIGIIRDRAITTEQKITIINTILIPHVAYRMLIVSIDTKKLRQWDNAIAKAINNSMGLINWLAGRETLYLDPHQGGLGLIALTDTQIISTTEGILSFGINSTDNLARETTIESLDSETNTDTPKEINSALKHIGAKLTETLAPFSTESLQPWVPNRLWRQLIQAETTNIGDFLKQGKTMNEKAEFVAAAPNENARGKRYIMPYETFKETIQHIRKNKTAIDQLRKENALKIKENDLYYSEIMDSYIVWTDGSFQRVKTGEDSHIDLAGSGIYSKTGSRINRGVRIPGLQNNYHAELFAIWTTLRVLHKRINVTIITDCEGGINSILNTKIHRDKFVRRSIFSPITVQIREMIKERTGKTEFKHCYSHLKELKIKAEKQTTEKEIKDEYERKMKAMEERFGDEKDKVIEGNDKADELAKKGCEEADNETIINLPETRMGIMMEEGYVATAGFRKTVKKKIQKKRFEEITKKRPTLLQIKEIEKELLRGKDPKTSKLRTFQYKLIHNKLLNPVKLNQRKVKWAPTDQSCILGCDKEEDTDHILNCPKNPRVQDDKEIIDIMNKIQPEYFWEYRQMWYSHPERHIQFPHEKEIEESFKAFKQKGNRGEIPYEIITQIKKTYKKEAKELIMELKLALLKRAKEIWNSRCKVLHEKIREEKAIRKEQEEVEKIKAEQEAERRRQERETALQNKTTRTAYYKRKRDRQKEIIKRKRTVAPNTGARQPQPPQQPPPPPPPPTTRQITSTKRRAKDTEGTMQTPPKRRKETSPRTNIETQLETRKRRRKKRKPEKQEVNKNKRCKM